MGDFDISSSTDEADPQDYKVSQIIAHPQYDEVQKYNDIALLRLDKDVEFNKFIRPACLHTKYELPKVNEAGEYIYFKLKNETIRTCI